uniref:Uncharacterized protein n=1 Tax=Acrobeloides nanus TaxID=290746 RepID=A0A914CEI9_9BILA
MKKMIRLIPILNISELEMNLVGGGMSVAMSVQEEDQKSVEISMEMIMIMTIKDRTIAILGSAIPIQKSIPSI